MKRKCVPQSPSFNYSSSFDEEEEEEEINEKRYFEIHQTIEQLENEMRKLEIDLNKEKSANALIKNEPVWHIRFENGHMMLDSEIKDFQELLLYGSSFIRYLSPFGYTFQTSSPSVYLDRLIDRYFYCYNNFIPLVHEKSYRKYIETLEDKLQDPVTLAMCASANIFDEPERYLESLMVVNILQPFMMTTLRFNDSKKWANLTDHTTRTLYASIHRSSVVAKTIMGIIDLVMDNRTDRFETFNEYLDILPDDPPFTKSVLEMFNYIVIIESHHITELVYKQSRELVLEGKAQLTLEDIACYESILMDWWHSLPDYFKISKGPFDCTKELIEACTDTQKLLMCLYVHGLVRIKEFMEEFKKSISPDHHVLTSSLHSSSLSLTTSELAVSAHDVYQNYPLPFEAFIFDMVNSSVMDINEV
ncbi:hypothetical protein RO3G_17186 [Rhizopus delemar RA 99-880]|uniref:Uncharacterized protein n=1 Tax=Rhizopus delemar (strain RA 99-880 / ATCC MYA-4621 / FGSC 9543 / NRRL 43880) TaxID=246409 RepID=I1CV35_RHIO9|nr:hypothetical protein RO3G_17186 [Rhizopus delemar RA 99-880]|eukprot:EIE92315.1 hypothetical protein RO3G_17186 [Rhizopus delemar RA 99-880]